MYTQSPCDLPNSESPMSQARIDAQNRRVYRAGSRFFRGNQIMTGMVAGLTPPAPTGSCDDLVSSYALDVLSPFPTYGGIPGVVSVPSVATSPATATAAPGSSSVPLAPGSVSSPSASGADYPLNDVQNAILQLVPKNCASSESLALLKSRGRASSNGSSSLWPWVLVAAAVGLLASSGGDS